MTTTESWRGPQVGWTPIRDPVLFPLHPFPDPCFINSIPYSSLFPFLLTPSRKCYNLVNKLPICPAKKMTDTCKSWRVIRPNLVHLAPAISDVGGDASHRVIAPMAEPIEMHHRVITCGDQWPNFVGRPNGHACGRHSQPYSLRAAAMRPLATTTVGLINFNFSN